MTSTALHARAGDAPPRLRLLVVGVAVAAAAVLVVAVDGARAIPADPWLLIATVLGITVTTAVPLPARRDGSEVTAHGHVAVLVPALFLLGWHGVVVAVAGGMAAGWLVRHLVRLPTVAPADGLLATTASIAAGTLAAAAAGAVGTMSAAGRVLPVMLAVAGALAFLGVERTLVAWVASVTDGSLLGPPAVGRRVLAVHATPLAFGLLGALVVAAYPLPAVWLVLHGALGTVIAVTGSSLDTDRAHHAALLRIAAHAHASMDRTTVERAVEDNLAPLLRAARVEIRDLPPGHGDVGTPLPLPVGDPAWLVASPRGRGAGFSARDRRLLASAAPLVANAVENARQHTDMTARATTDPLTGVANRRAFEEQLALRLRHSRISDRATALVVLDLDDFKAVNDEIGHGAGDDVLVEIARRLTTATRADDLVARLGGDEFAVVATAASPDEVNRLRDRLQDRLAGLCAADGRVMHASLGIAVAPHDGRSSKALFDAADERMYAVKRSS